MNSVVAQISNLIPKLRPADRDRMRKMLDNGVVLLRVMMTQSLCT